MSTLHSGPSNLHTHQAGHIGERAHAVLMHQNSKILPVACPISNATSVVGQHLADVATHHCITRPVCLCLKRTCCRRSYASFGR